MKFLIILLLITASISLSGGTWVDTTFVPPSLGISKGLIVYLPEGYDPGGTIDYPVIYHLHGWGGNQYDGQAAMTVVMDSLIAGGLIAPALVVQPNGFCDPFDGSMWANSELYGNYEDYVSIDLIAFIDSTFRTIPDRQYRCIGGYSMGGAGSMDLALRHLDLYKAVVSASADMDFQTCLQYFIPSVLEESPETEPPYTYDCGNGIFTDAMFLYSGGYSPHLGNPYDVDFPLDSNGELIDSVYVLWDLHNPAHMIKFISIPGDFGIFFDCGDEDFFPGLYESNVGYSDTLTALGIGHTFISWPGLGHTMTIERKAIMMQFASDYMLGIPGSHSTQDLCMLLPAAPNPFTSTTTIRFELPEASHVSLHVYDVSGRMVESLVSEELGVGLHSFALEREDLVPGMYIIVFKAGAAVETRNCILLRR